MTSGHALPADDQPKASSTTPNDGPPSEPPSTDETFPITAGNLSELLRDTFQNGWESARTLPQREKLEVTFSVKIDRETESVTVQPIVIP